MKLALKEGFHYQRRNHVIPDVDSRTVIPSMLKVGDIPELLVAAQQCQILFCQARDLKASDQEWMQQRFRKVLSQAGGEGITYAPDRKCAPELLLKWP